MTDLTEDFLNGAASRLSDLEGSFNMLKENPAEKKGWDALYSFFDFVRSVAPFAGFMRSYRLADAGIREIREYREQKKGLETLPAILLKLQRIRKILSAAVRLKREARQSDDDILPPVVEKNDFQQSFGDKGKNAADLSAQETALDKREEELVVWAQTLAEQEEELKRKENIVFKEERSQAVSQEKINAVLNKLSEQQKVQLDLEDDLAETRLALQNCQEKMISQADLQKKAENLLKTKEIALTEMGKKILELKNLLEEKKTLSEVREEQLCQELQQNREQTQELQNNFEILKQTHSAEQKDRQRISSQYRELEQEYQNKLQLLAEEKENKEQMLLEKRELEQQHLEFNTRMVALQENLNAEKENQKHTEALLRQQKHYGEIIQSELLVAGWPYNTEKIQKDLAVLARQGRAKGATESLIAIKELIGKIRTHSLIRIPEFFENVAQATAKRYRRPYQITVNCDATCGMDKDAMAALKQMIVQMTDNAFNYALPENRGTLSLNFEAKEEGAFVHCLFFDNGTVFDFDRLRNMVQIAGLTEGKETKQSGLLAYLFHNAVKFKNRTRGLVNVVRSIEKAGGRVYADFDNGLRIDFSVPKHFLFDKVLVFQLADQLLALPLNAVEETVFLKDGDIKTNPETNEGFFYWKGEALPVLSLSPSERTDFGLVIQAGVFRFFLPVQQVSEAENVIVFSEKASRNDGSYLSPCTLLESGREMMWVDLSELLRQVVLPLPEKVVDVPEEDVSKEPDKSETAYLVFKSEPSVFSAVRVDRVLRVEDFTFSAHESAHKKLLETQDGVLPLRDSCPREGYPHARFALIFKEYALAVQEVVDIVNIPSSDKPECIVYLNKKVPVFEADA